MESEKADGAAGGRKITGHISQIIGPVVDVAFEGPENEIVLPSIHDAMDIRRDDGRTLIVEVQQHIGEHTVRTVAMDCTDGLRRGTCEVTSAFGRADLDARGRADQGPPDERRGRERSTACSRLDGTGAGPDPPRAAEVRRTGDGRRRCSTPGIKVIDLLEPYVQGRQRSACSAGRASARPC